MVIIYLVQSTEDSKGNIELCKKGEEHPMHHKELEERIKAELTQYKKIVLYGTGHWAEYILPYLKRNQILSRVYAIVDRDDSSMIEKKFHGYTVKKLSDILERADSIVIVSKDYWQPISKRVHKILDEQHIHFPVIELLSADFLYKNRKINTTYVDNRIKNVLSKCLVPHFYILCVESMGDIIACEPITRKLKKDVTNSKVTWIIKQEYVEVVKYNPFVDEVVEVSCLGEADEFCNNLDRHNSVMINCHFNGRRCTKTKRVHQNDINPMIDESTYYNYGALLENFSLTAGMQKISDTPLFHENVNAKNPIDIENKYAVFHCKSSEISRDWQPDKWNEVAYRMMKKGYIVVEIGLVPIITSKSKKYYDCTYIHDIQTIAQIIKEASIFIGCDSGFAHIANCYNKKAILLLGKYRSFSRPMPYTGYYAKQKENTIIYANNASVQSLSVEEVYNKILEKML